MNWRLLSRTSLHAARRVRWRFIPDGRWRAPRRSCGPRCHRRTRRYAQHVVHPGEPHRGYVRPVGLLARPPKDLLVQAAGVTAGWRPATGPIVADAVVPVDAVSFRAWRVDVRGDGALGRVYVPCVECCTSLAPRRVYDATCRSIGESARVSQNGPAEGEPRRSLVRLRRAGDGCESRPAGTAAAADDRGLCGLVGWPPAENRALRCFVGLPSSAEGEVE